MYGSAAHERRRNEVIWTVKTLDQLAEVLQSEGYELKRSSVHLHLLPRNHRTIEGKRHVKAAPVKLYKAQNSKHASHAGTKFARYTIRSIEEIAAILGPAEVVFHSQDDKAKVLIGLTAAKKQSPLIMHMKYQISLQYHDFIVAPNHKVDALSYRRHESHQEQRPFERRRHVFRAHKVYGVLSILDLQLSNIFEI